MLLPCLASITTTTRSTQKRVHTDSIVHHFIRLPSNPAPHFIICDVLPARAKQHPCQGIAGGFQFFQVKRGAHWHPRRCRRSRGTRAHMPFSGHTARAAVRHPPRCLAPRCCAGWRSGGPLAAAAPCGGPGGGHYGRDRFSIAPRCRHPATLAATPAATLRAPRTVYCREAQSARAAALRLQAELVVRRLGLSLRRRRAHTHSLRFGGGAASALILRAAEVAAAPGGLGYSTSP